MKLLTDKEATNKISRALMREIINSVISKNISSIWSGINFWIVKSTANSFKPILFIRENNHPWKGGSANLKSKAGVNIK